MPAIVTNTKDALLSKVFFKKYHQTGKQEYLEKALELKSRSEGDMMAAEKYRKVYERLRGNRQEAKGTGF